MLYDRGMKAALEYASSVGEEKVKLIQLDDSSDPSTATRNARKLVEENKVDLMIGTATAAIAPGEHAHIHNVVSARQSSELASAAVA